MRALRRSFQLQPTQPRRGGQRRASKPRPQQALSAADRRRHLIYANGIPESLVGITKHSLSIDPCDKGGEASLGLEFGKTGRFDGDLGLVGSGERGVGGSHRSVTMGVLGVSNMTNLEIPGTWRIMDSTVNQDLASRGDLEVVF